MSDKIRIYVNDVLNFINADDKTKNRISKDLYSHIYEASQTEDLDWVLNNMGNPKNVAMDFMENIDDDISYKSRNNYQNQFYEYKSKTEILGLPLVHIKLHNKFGLRYNLKLERAKGIIAIGEVATGVLFGFGFISTGLISLGCLSLGLLLSFGAISIGGISLGGIAIGGLAIGGFAIGIEAIGGLAVAKNVAIGGAAFGTTAIGDAVNGVNTLHVQNPPISELRDFLQNNDPGKNSFILKILNLFL